MPVAALFLGLGGDNVFTKIALFFSQMAVVTFGGAYAVLAYVAQQAVEQYHWLTAREMLDGLGMAETTPGPLIMVLQFVGFLGAYRHPGMLSPLLAGCALAVRLTFGSTTKPTENVRVQAFEVAHDRKLVARGGFDRLQFARPGAQTWVDLTGASPSFRLVDPVGVVEATDSFDGLKLLVVPSFILIAIITPRTKNSANIALLIVLLAGFSWMVSSRMVRGLTMSLREREFVQAARYMGVPSWRIITRHIVPNVASILIIDTALNVGVAILAETGLSFLGFGVQPPDVSLGTPIADGTKSATTFPWVFLFPAGVLVLILMCANLTGDGLRDALDPGSATLRQRRKKKRT